MRPRVAIKTCENAVRGPVKLWEHTKAYKGGRYALTSNA